MEKEPHDLENRQDNFAELIEEFYNNVHWRQFHALLVDKPIPNSLDLVKRTFKISSDEVIDMIEGLSRLGLLKQQNEQFHAKKLQFIVPDHIESKESRISGHKSQSFEILNSLHKDKECCGDMTYISASQEDINWFRLEYRKLINELEKKSLTCQNKDLFSITYTDVKTHTNKWEDK